jgi:hypothetical protein
MTVTISRQIMGCCDPTTLGIVRALPLRPHRGVQRGAWKAA